MTRIVFFFGCLIVLLGCSTKQAAVLPQVSNHTEAKTELVNVHDTLMQKDSVIIIQRGDTIYHMEKHMIYNPVVRYESHTDTVIHNDTVSVPVYIEKKSSLQNLVSGYGCVGFFLVLLGILAYQKLKK